MGLFRKSPNGPESPRATSRDDDARTLERLVTKYEDEARAAGVSVRSVTIGEALDYLRGVSY